MAFSEESVKGGYYTALPEYILVYYHHSNVYLVAFRSIVVVLELF